MENLISCEFNIDTACVELKYSDGTMISIDTIAVENEVAETWLDRREMDYLIYNDPVGYCRSGVERRYEEVSRYSATGADNFLITILNR